MTSRNGGSVMNHSTFTALSLLIAFATCTARADIVTDWNHTAIDVMKAGSIGGNPWSRTLAMMHVAMSDAINAVHGRYTRVVATVPAVPGASAEAAARQLSAAKGLDLIDNARLFALLNMGIANTFINDWDAKFTYNFWRPVTAIRNGDMDGNDATERDPSWTSFNATPMHPEYPSQAAIVAGVAVGVLESVCGPNPAIPFTATDLMDPKLTRPFTNIAQIAEEHKNVRIWGGIHFRNSLDVGEDMGRKIAAYLVDHALTPAC